MAHVDWFVSRPPYSRRVEKKRLVIQPQPTAALTIFLALSFLILFVLWGASVWLLCDLIDQLLLQ